MTTQKYLLEDPTLKPLAKQPAQLMAQNLKVGGRYNWKNQPERLVYLGMCEPRNGRWHQFSLVDKPDEVWCEVHWAEIHMLEETVQAP